ncbi:MAG: hypothetical protein IT384_11820 [Deltaproteobacteria bacterium]|nr:hypothetical protein [Deltaproteobacteria bacterium]
MIRGAKVVIAVSGALLLSCSGEPETPPPAEVAADRLCAELAAAECGRLERCGLLDTSFDRASCDAWYQDGFSCTEAREIAALSAAGRIGYDARAAASCRDALAATECTLGMRIDLLRSAACNGVFSGGTAEGERCSVDGQCAAGLYCDGLDGACPARCRAPLGNNQPCDGSVRCAAGFFCSATGRRCLAAAGTGAPCELSFAGNSCRDGSFCDSSQPGAARCVMARSRGAGCTSPYQCALGMRCIGGRCSQGREDDGCATDVDCEDGLVCGAAHCVVPGGVDADCASSGACLPSLACVADNGGGGARCTARPRLDQTCGGGQPACFLARCDSEHCVPPAEDGGACSMAEDCRVARGCQASTCLSLSLLSCGS